MLLLKRMKLNKLYQYSLAICFSILLILSCAPTQAAAAVNVVYVTEQGSGSRSGASWGNALGAAELAGALENAAAGVEFWIAAGNYRPDYAGDRTKTFALQAGVALYGGFGGTETIRTQRDWENNPTVLTGDIGTPGDAGDNSYHVVTAIGTGDSAVIDGFTIRDGNADVLTDRGGAGMYNKALTDASGDIVVAGNNPTVANCVFENNSAPNGGGGGMHNLGSSPKLSNVTFRGNSAYMGGAMYNDALRAASDNEVLRSSEPAIDECLFRENSAVYGGGAITSDWFAAPTVKNSLFEDNVVTSQNVNGSEGGGAVHNRNGSARFENSVFKNNRAIKGGAAFNFFGDVVYKDCYFEGNRAEDTASTQGNGGAAYSISASIDLRGSTFLDNYARSYGGALYSFSNSSGIDYLTVVNSTFYQNESVSGGGAVFLFGTSLGTKAVIVSSTFAANRTAGYGGAVANNGASGATELTLANVILWDNVSGNASGNGFQAYNFGSGAALTARHSVVQSGDLYNNAGTLDMDEIVDADPLLGSFGDHGGRTPTVAILEGSSAIDAGLPAGTAIGNGIAIPAFDQRGFERSENADVGAFEFTRDDPTPPNPEPCDGDCGSGCGAFVPSAFLLLLAIPIVLARKK